MLYADFQLMDAIEEFGERRFVKPFAPRLRAGPLRIHPSLRTQIEYDDNILLEEKDEREDVVYNIQPGAILELPIGTHQITAGYEADFEVFSKGRHSRQNDQNQNFFALADLRFPDWYVNVLERLSETSGRSGTTFTERIPRIDQSIHPKIGYRWKRLIIESGFRHSVRDFRRQVDDSLDFQIVEFTQVFYYDLFARLKALLEYQFAQIDYDDNFTRNGTFNQVRVGLEGEVYRNLTVRLKTGGQWRNYEEDAKSTFKSWVGEASAEYQARKNLKFQASFGREPIEATFGNVNYYTQHIFRLGAEYEFRPRWIAFSQFKYYTHHYAEPSQFGNIYAFRRDYHTSVRTGLRYLPREWFEIEMAYQFVQRDSNFPTLDYDNNRFSLSSTLSY